MTEALTVQRDHLREHRRMLIGRSLLASLVSLVPVPIVDDRLTFAVLSNLYRKIAASYHVDVDRRALEGLVFGKESSPNAVKTAASTLAFRFIARSWRRLLFTYMTAHQAQIAGHHFARATLFEHYCAKLHLGIGLGAKEGLELRQLMDQAMDETPGTLGTRLFRRGLLAAARATARAPKEIFQLLGGERLRKLLTKGEPDEEDKTEEALAINAMEVAMEEQMREQKSFFGRSATAIEFQLSVEANPYLEQLIENFERLWRQRQAQRS